MQKKIFISCASKDRQVALTICNAIEARGLACWISSRDVGPGENFQGEIVRAIRNAGLMVLIFSANANHSAEINKEIALAGQNKLVVIPVRIEDVIPSEELSYEFATRQWIDVFDNWERAIQQLLVQITKVLSPSVADPQHPAAPGASAVPPVSQPYTAPRTPKTAGGKPQRASVVVRKRSFFLGAGALLVLLLIGSGILILRAPSMSPGFPAAPVVDARNVETKDWEAVRDSKDVRALQSYLGRYPKGMFADAARTRIAALNKPTKVVAVSPANSLSSPAANNPPQADMPPPANRPASRRRENSAEPPANSQATPATAVPSHADSLQETLTEFGLLGRWSIQCGRSAAPNNQIRTYAMLSPSEGQISIDSGSRVFVETIMSAQKVDSAPDEMQIGYSLPNGMNVSDTIEMRQGRFRSISRIRANGRVMLQGGLNLSNGREVVWWERCD